MEEHSDKSCKPKGSNTVDHLYRRHAGNEKKAQATRPQSNNTLINRTSTRTIVVILTLRDSYSHWIWSDQNVKVKG